MFRKNVTVIETGAGNQDDVFLDECERSEEKLTEKLKSPKTPTVKNQTSKTKTQTPSKKTSPRKICKEKKADQFQSPKTPTSKHQTPKTKTPVSAKKTPTRVKISPLLTGHPNICLQRGSSVKKRNNSLLSPIVTSAVKLFDDEPAKSVEYFR